ncbi:MAG TPA: hypothetical protein VFU78_05390, partial [Thermomicrobiales bacterium]|nr:hypothetical protein [Thermomicrobiales bacterium]
MDDIRMTRIEQRLDQLDHRVRDIEAWARQNTGYPLWPVAPPAPPATMPAARPKPEPATRPPTPAPPPVVRVPVAAVPAPQRSATEPSWSLSDFEQLLSGRGLAWLGGLAILIGAVFF